MNHETENQERTGTRCDVPERHSQDRNWATKGSFCRVVKHSIMTTLPGRSSEADERAATQQPVLGRDRPSSEAMELEETESVGDSATHHSSTAPANSGGGATRTHDGPAHTIKTTPPAPSESHRERRARMDRADIADDHQLPPPDELDRPGAERIVGHGGIHDDESNTVIVGQPDADDGHQVPGDEVATVIAWTVEPQVEQPSPGGDNPDAVGQGAADLPEAVVQKGVAVWIQGHMAWTAILIATFVAAVVIPLSILLAKGTDASPTVAPIPPNLSSTEAPTSSTVSATEAPAPLDRFSQLMRIIEAQTPGDEALVVESLSPHQFQALTWLADNDTYTLEMDFRTADPIYVVQRYALAATYYSTGGWPDERCLPFMSGLDHCAWQVDSYDDCYVNSTYSIPYGYSLSSHATGVSCNNDGYVTSLFLGK
jgi:hypothetical protein